MAKLQAEVLLREFNYNGVRIPDPAPHTAEWLRIRLVRDRRILCIEDASPGSGWLPVAVPRPS